MTTFVYRHIYQYSLYNIYICTFILSITLIKLKTTIFKTFVFKLKENIYAEIKSIFKYCKNILKNI